MTEEELLALLPNEEAMETLRVCIESLNRLVGDPKIVVGMLVGGAIQNGFRVMSDDGLRDVMDAILTITREQREAARKLS